MRTIVVCLILSLLAMSVTELTWAEQPGQPDGFPRHLVVLPPFLAGMQGVARAVQRADLDPGLVQAAAEIAPLAGVLQQPNAIEMRRRRPVAAGEFQRVHAEPRGERQHRVKIESGDAVGDHANLHANLHP